MVVNLKELSKEDFNLLSITMILKLSTVEVFIFAEKVVSERSNEGVSYRIVEMVVLVQQKILVIKTRVTRQNADNLD